MPHPLIDRYHNDLARALQHGKSTNEQSVRNYFWQLLPKHAVVEVYNEMTLKDPTIREKFNTYRFADHKEKVIDLLKRVCTVSARTVVVVEQMRK